MRSSSTPSILPAGFAYHPEWITAEEESTLLGHIERLRFCEVRMHGVTAKRKVVHFGWDYGYDSWTISPTEPVPEWLLTLRARAAGVLGAAPEAVEEVLVTRYEPGAGIGWHRDAPMFGPVVIGVSLLGTCRMRFQRTVAGQRYTAEAVLSPRSLYILAGEARAAWQHSIPPAKQLRYSITLRTLKEARAAAGAAPRSGLIAGGSTVGEIQHEPGERRNSGRHSDLHAEADPSDVNSVQLQDNDREDDRKGQGHHVPS